jgi:hypothetical protein
VHLSLDVGILETEGECAGGLNYLFVQRAELFGEVSRERPKVKESGGRKVV